MDTIFFFLTLPNLHSTEIKLDTGIYFTKSICTKNADYKFNIVRIHIDHVHNILRLSDGWTNFPFTTRETKCDYK